MTRHLASRQSEGVPKSRGIKPETQFGVDTPRLTLRQVAGRRFDALTEGKSVIIQLPLSRIEQGRDRNGGSYKEGRF